MVTSGGGATSSSGGLGSPRAPSPQRQSVFNQLATQMGVLGERAGGPRGLDAGRRACGVQSA